MTTMVVEIASPEDIPRVQKLQKGRLEWVETSGVKEYLYRPSKNITITVHFKILIFKEGKVLYVEHPDADTEEIRWAVQGYMKQPLVELENLSVRELQRAFSHEDDLPTYFSQDPHAYIGLFETCSQYIQGTQIDEYDLQKSEITYPSFEGRIKYKTYIVSQLFQVVFYWNSGSELSYTDQRNAITGLFPTALYFSNHRWVLFREEVESHLIVEKFFLELAQSFDCQAPSHS